MPCDLLHEMLYKLLSRPNQPKSVISKPYQWRTSVLGCTVGGQSTTVPYTSAHESFGHGRTIQGGQIRSHSWSKQKQLILMESQYATPEGDQNITSMALSCSTGPIIALATSIRHRVFGITTSSAMELSKGGWKPDGIYVVQLDDFKLVIRVPAWERPTSRASLTTQAAESQVTTLQYLAKYTALPLPNIYAIESKSNNDIGTPYICMRFIPGRPVHEAWFDDIPDDALEARRLAILSNIARTMAQFSAFSYSKIGSLYEKPGGGLAVGECCAMTYDQGEQLGSNFGPFDDTTSFLQASKAQYGSSGLLDAAVEKILDTMIRLLPVTPNEGFVLSPPELDSRNILVDEQGYVTGILNWDGVQTCPRCLGYARYPSFITRDWNPYTYMVTDTENTPGELSRYREHYRKELGKALGHAGDWKYTQNSHVTEAVWIATLNPSARLHICTKLIEEVRGKSHARTVMDAIRENRLSKQAWEELVRGLQKLVMPVRQMHG